jgi:hypothetical protein
MIKKVISGGQTGADIAGLRAAKACKIPTGGCAPKSYWTHKGSNLELKTVYGLRKHESPQYPPRTVENVKNSDGTIRFAKDFESRGEKCTLNAIQYWGKHYIDVDIKDQVYEGEIERVITWLKEKDIRILNVAGNAHNKGEEIEEFVEQFLIKLFQTIYGKYCSICSRETPAQYMEKHHIVPASKKGKETMSVCVPCGDQLHQLFSNKEMESQYNTLEKILDNEKIQGWIKFVRKRNDFHVCMKRKK